MENTVQYCKEKLVENGFRITPQRLSVFCSLVQSKTHPSAEMIYKKVKKEYPNISFDTVNRTVLSLLEKGLIQMVEGGHGPRRFDADLKPHYHFRCIYCKKIVDFDCPEYNNVKVPDDVRKRFRVLRQRIILEGICPECYENRRKKIDFFEKQKKLT